MNDADARFQALILASQNSSVDIPVQDVLARADAYYKFLTTAAE
jgi:hypothetical protein